MEVPREMDLETVLLKEMVCFPRGMGFEKVLLMEMVFPMELLVLPRKMGDFLVVEAPCQLLTHQ